MPTLHKSLSRQLHVYNFSRRSLAILSVHRARHSMPLFLWASTALPDGLCRKLSADPASAPNLTICCPTHWMKTPTAPFASRTRSHFPSIQAGNRSLGKNEIGRMPHPDRSHWKHDPRHLAYAQRSHRDGVCKRQCRGSTTQTDYDLHAVPPAPMPKRHCAMGPMSEAAKPILAVARDDDLRSSKAAPTYLPPRPGLAVTDFAIPACGVRQRLDSDSPLRHLE